MKKLFAGLVALLALAPVVANAASYTAGQYVNFAGTADDAANFHSENYDQWILDNSGVGTLYIEDTTHTDSNGNKYLKVMSLINSMGDFSDEGVLDTSFFESEVADLIREDVKTPYGYASSGSNVDVSIATKADVTKLLGVNAAGDSANLSTDVVYAFSLMLKDKAAGTYYFYTGTKNGASEYFALAVHKTGEIVDSIQLVSRALTEGEEEFVIPVIEMNSAYVCSGDTEKQYACYECPSDNNKTILSWLLKGSQADNCKEVDKPKSKCATSPKTGVDSYLIPSAIVLGVCAIVLTVLKRKDAFKAI